MDFSLDESSESVGILYVFPAFGTARIGEKNRCLAEGDLFGDSLTLFFNFVFVHVSVGLVE